MQETPDTLARRWFREVWTVWERMATEPASGTASA